MSVIIVRSNPLYNRIHDSIRLGDWGSLTKTILNYTDLCDQKYGIKYHIGLRDAKFEFETEEALTLFLLKWT